MMNRLLALVLLTSVCDAGRAEAQTISSLPAGARVQITIADSARQSPFFPRAKSLIGTVARATPDTLWLQVTGSDTVAVPRGTLRRLYVSRGVSRTRSAVEQALSAGAIAVLIFSAPTDDPLPHRKALGIGAIAAGLGAALGAWRPYERWRRVR
jgi:hypothetical protein